MPALTRETVQRRLTAAQKYLDDRLAAGLDTTEDCARLAAHVARAGPAPEARQRLSEAGVPLGVAKYRPATPRRLATCWSRLTRRSSSPSPPPSPRWWRDRVLFAT